MVESQLQLYDRGIIRIGWMDRWMDKIHSERKSNAPRIFRDQDPRPCDPEANSIETDEKLDKGSRILSSRWKRFTSREGWEGKGKIVGLSFRGLVYPSKRHKNNRPWFSPHDISPAP